MLACAGSQGVFLLHKSPGQSWEYHPRGSRSWDYFHQAVFRNGRADPLEQSAVTTLPPLPALPAVTWVDPSAKRRVTKEVTEGLLFDKVKAAPKRKLAVYWVLRDDLYEARFGDGRFVDLDAVFFGEEEARAWVETHAHELIVHSIRQGEVTMRRGHLELEHFQSGEFETATVDQILEALACRLEGKRWPILDF